MIISSEYVTIGHPDRMCDQLASKLINLIQQKDKYRSHAAIEVFATKDTIIFGGEVTTSLKITKKLLKSIVKEVFEDLGYNNERKIILFGSNNLPSFKHTKIINKISKQSEDIAITTTNKGIYSGFNDQGIFYGGYDSMTPTGQGFAKYIAQGFGDYLFEFAKNNNFFGTDIKIKLDIESDDGYTPKSFTNITIAIPYYNGILQNDIIKYKFKEYYDDLIKKYPNYIFKEVDYSNFNFIINHSNRFIKHGYIADTSMTGRKLAVNNISAGPIFLQNQIGGGSYIKPWHASDLLLPMACNWIAKYLVEKNHLKYINVAMSCSIGSQNIDNISIYGDDNIFDNVTRKNLENRILHVLNLSPNGLINYWNFFNYDFDKINKSNFVFTDKILWNDTSILHKMD